jgi:predicted amidohydrolase
MKSHIRIAQVKIVPAKGDLAGNHARLMAALAELASCDVDVVVTPECFLDGYVCTEDEVTSETIARFAVDPADNPYVDEVAAWAARRQAWLVFGCLRRSAEGVYNTALIFDRRGQLKGMYDKTHCQTHDRKYCAGNGIAAFESDFGAFGVLICADRRWPETVRSLALQGARIIFNPTYGMHDERNLWMMRTRSYESEVFIAFTHPQQALLTGPAGQIVADERADSILYVVNEIDLSETDRVRAGASAHLRDRRPDLYVR